MLLGLRDSYEVDGRVVTEILDEDALPVSLRVHHPSLEKLGAVYKHLDAPFGEFAKNILVASTNALKSGSSTDDSKYTSIESQIDSLTALRDALADEIRTGLNNAEFNDVKPDEKQVKAWTETR